MGLLMIFKNKNKGQGLVEYGLILALVSFVAVGALGDVGDKATSVFDTASIGLNDNYLLDSADSLYFGDQQNIKTVIPNNNDGIVKDNLNIWLDGNVQNSHWVNIVNGNNQGIVNGVWGDEALEFNGNDSHVQLANPLTLLNGSFTVETKLKYNGGRAILLGDFNLPGSSNVDFEILSTRELRTTWGFGGSNSKDIIARGQYVPTNKWVHIAFTYDRPEKELKYYIDGELVYKESILLEKLAFEVPHRIGMDSRSGSIHGYTPLDGEISEFRIYKDSLDVSEIKQNIKSDIPSEILDYAKYAKEYLLDFPLRQNKSYTVSVDATNNKLIGVWVGKDHFAGYIGDNGSLTIDGVDGVDNIILKTISPDVTINRVSVR